MTAFRYLRLHHTVRYFLFLGTVREIERKKLTEKPQKSQTCKHTNISYSYNCRPTTVLKQPKIETLTLVTDAHTRARTQKRVHTLNSRGYIQLPFAFK